MVSIFPNYAKFLITFIMRLASPLAFISLAIAVAPHALPNATFIAGEIAQIPQCGLACLVETVPSVGCSLANTTCQCTSSELVTETARCMLANCTFQDGLELSKIQAAICGLPVQSHNKGLRIMTIICAIITYTAVLLRLTSRLLLVQTFGADDYFILAAATSDAIFTYYGVQLERDGFGNHLRDINIQSVPRLLISFYICEVLYLLTIGLVKLSVIFFYLRVFPKKSFRILCLLMSGFCISSMLAFILVTVFQCRPVSFAWERDLLARGKCIDYNAAAWANAGVNILQDILIVILPMNELKALQLGRMKKFWVFAMFGVGGFVCFTSIIRLSSLRSFGLTADPTWDNVPATLWSTIETTAAIFCACLPAVRASVNTLFPSVRITTIQKSSPSTGNTKMAQSSILVTRQVMVQRSRMRISGINLSPTFNAWRVLESALGPRSPQSNLSVEEHKIYIGMDSPLPGLCAGAGVKK